MTIIFPLFLMLLGLVCGIVATYFIMDDPRRRALMKLEKLDEREQILSQELEETDLRKQVLDSRTSQLERLSTGLTRREQSLFARMQEFERKAVSYTDLENENRLLRAELKNIVVHTAFLEHLRQTDKAGHTSVSEQRDELGQLYFNEVSTSARKAITASNLPQNNQRVRTAAERVRSEGVELTPEQEEQALNALKTQFEKAVRAQEERERQAELREQMREEIRRQREIEAAEAAARQAELERKAVEEALARAKAEAARDAAEAFGKQSAEAAAQHMAEIKDLEAKLLEAEMKSQKAISNAQLTKMGCVYVISNIGSFGEGVFKIGMTRRSNPDDRVKELGDASVPFPFDIHMKIKCDDAPALEYALHREFHHKRKNKVNLRKEFFEVTIADIANVVERLHGKVEYTADAEALEFKNSLTATDADLEEIEEVFAKSDGLPNPSIDEE